MPVVRLVERALLPVVKCLWKSKYTVFSFHHKQKKREYFNAGNAFKLRIHLKILSRWNILFMICNSELLFCAKIGTKSYRSDSEQYRDYETVFIIPGPSHNIKNSKTQLF